MILENSKYKANFNRYFGQIDLLAPDWLPIFTERIFSKPKKFFLSQFFFEQNFLNKKNIYKLKKLCTLKKNWQQKNYTVKKVLLEIF